MNKTLLILALLLVGYYCAQSQSQSQSQSQGQSQGISSDKSKTKPTNNATTPVATPTPSSSNNSKVPTTSVNTNTSTNKTSPTINTTPNSTATPNPTKPSTPITPSTPSTPSTPTPPSVSTNQPVSNNSSQSKMPWFGPKLLDLHNVLKMSVNQANYTWSDSLYKSAQSWADYLASSYNFYHSGTAGVGENIATATIRDTDMVSLMFSFWSAEKKYFIPWKRFPDCSTTGNWGDVAHYTQLVWGASTQVGCGLGINTYNNVLVCQYSLPGNYIGNYVYLNQTSPN